MSDDCGSNAGYDADKICLSQAIIQHNSNVQLSEAQLDQLTAMQENKSFRQRLTNKLVGFRTYLERRTRLKIAAVCFVLCATLVSLLLLPNQNKTWQVLNEVAYNHNKQMSLEIASANIADINTYLSQLDFSLINSVVLDTEQWQLLGGRYCSIDSQLAAQLKVRNKDDQQIYTFYQALVPDQIAADSALEGYVDGVKVRLWQERGLLMGLAGVSLP